MNQICTSLVTYVTKLTSLEENKKAELIVVVSRANSVIKKMAEHGEVWDFVEVKLQFVSKKPEARLWGFGDGLANRLVSWRRCLTGADVQGVAISTEV
ncbi:hypothetical protein Droror1_Dr00008703 [Drosera rotundifolia]